MKKILISVFIILGFFVFNTSANNIDCQYVDSKNPDLSQQIGDCLKASKLAGVDNDLQISPGGGFKTTINKWTNNIALFLGILSVGSIVFGGAMMMLSAGEDEKISKAKDIVKWSIFGFLGVIMATTIITVITNLIYGVADKVDVGAIIVIF